MKNFRFSRETLLSFPRFSADATSIRITYVPRSFSLPNNFNSGLLMNPGTDPGARLHFARARQRRKLFAALARIFQRVKSTQPVANTARCANYVFANRVKFTLSLSLSLSLLMHAPNLLRESVVCLTHASMQ